MVGGYMEPEVVLMTGDRGEDIEACRVCGREEPLGWLLRCGVCGEKKHPRCVGGNWIRTRAGPWYCRDCRGRLMRQGVVDVLLDEELLRYLSHREAPPGPEALERVVAASRYLRLDREGRLWVTGAGGSSPRLIPEMVDR